MTKDLIKKELYRIIYSEQTDVKVGSDGVYDKQGAVTQYEYEDLIDKIIVFIQAITDPENQPNQYGIKLYEK